MHILSIHGNGATHMKSNKANSDDFVKTILLKTIMTGFVLGVLDAL